MLWHASPFLSLFGLAEAEQSPRPRAKRNKTDLFRGTSVQCTPQHISLMMPVGIRFTSWTLSASRQQPRLRSPSGADTLNAVAARCSSRPAHLGFALLIALPKDWFSHNSFIFSKSYFGKTSQSCNYFQLVGKRRAHPSSAGAAESCSLSWLMSSENDNFPQSTLTFFKPASFRLMAPPTKRSIQIQRRTQIKIVIWLLTDFLSSHCQINGLFQLCSFYIQDLNQ